MTFDGGQGLTATQATIAPALTDQVAGQNGLRFGENIYATEAFPLSKPYMMFKSWAWDGINGYSVGSFGWSGFEQNSDTEGDAKFSWKFGGFSGEVMSLDHSGELTTSGPIVAGGPVRLPAHTASGAPSPLGSGVGSLIFLSDEVGGATIAFSDGTDWRRVSDRAIAS